MRSVLFAFRKKTALFCHCYPSRPCAKVVLSRQRGGDYERVQGDEEGSLENSAERIAADFA